MRALDLTDQVFGTLTAKTPATLDNKRGWNCDCSCGKSKWVPTFQLTSGNTKTCGDGLHKQTIKIGDRFGKLVVKRVYRDSKNRRYMAECLCDCGVVKPNASFKNLQREATMHCGCSPDYSNMGLPSGIAARNSLAASYRSNARKKGLEFSLSETELDSLFGGNCYFCGQPPSEVMRKKGIKGSFTHSGIDRIDSSVGYVSGNVASCCTACNFLKGNRSNKQFLDHIKKIYEHSM